MTPVLALLLAAYLAVIYTGLEGPVAQTLAATALFLFPGQALMVASGVPRSRARDLLLSAALSPLLVGGVTLAALARGAEVGTWVTALVLGAGAMAVFLRWWDRLPHPEDGEEAGRTAWWVGLLFAAAIAAILAFSPWRRITSDAWFHVAVVHEMARSGIPPEDPYFAGLPLQYFWFFHTVLLGFLQGARLAPEVTMAVLNIVGAGLCVPAAARVGKALGVSPAAAVWGGVVFLLGMGGLFWLFYPVKLLGALVGETRGMEAVRETLRVFPLTPETTGNFAILFHSSSFLLRKFLVGTAASWGMLMILLAADQALRLVRDAQPHHAAGLFFSAVAAFLFHVVLGGASLAALALAAAFLFLTGKAPRGRTFALGGLVVLAVAVCIPYLQATASTKESDNLFPIGINLWYWASLPVTLLGVTVLALPRLRLWWRERSAVTALFLGWLAASGAYALFGRLPGPNQFDKPPMVVYLPLALAAGFAVPMWWRGLRDHPGRRVVFALLLFLFLVPENTLRYAGFFADRHPPVLTSAEEHLYQWIGEETERDAVFIDSSDRVDILLRGPRRQYWGKEAYAFQWGYPVKEMNTRRAVRDALYAGGPPQEWQPLDAWPDPVYVVVREADHPGAASRLAALPRRFTPVFSADGIRVFRYRGNGS